MKPSDAVSDEVRKTDEVPNAISAADMVALVKKLVKRSLSLHFQAFYLFQGVGFEVDNIIWAGVADISPLIDDAEFENAVRDAWREFRRGLDLGWGADVDQMICQIFVFGTAEQRYDAGIAIARTHDAIGPSPQGEKLLRQLYKSIDRENPLPPEIDAQMMNVRAAADLGARLNLLGFKS